MHKGVSKKALSGRVACLESQVDHLESELTYLNGLLVEVGFSDGIQTLKETAEELLKETKSSSNEHFKGYLF